MEDVFSEWLDEFEKALGEADRNEKLGPEYYPRFVFSGEHDLSPRGSSQVIYQSNDGKQTKIFDALLACRSVFSRAG